MVITYGCIMTTNTIKLTAVICKNREFVAQMQI